MSLIKIACSPLSKRIFANYTLKNNTWAAGKQDVTVDALVAVAELVVKFGKPVKLTCDGKVAYKITVEVLE